MGNLGNVRTVTLLLAAALLLALAFLASWLALPVRRVEVVGARQLPPEALARLGHLYAGAPWLYAPFWAQKRIAAHPQIAAVRLSRQRQGVLRLEVKERLPLAVWEDPLGFPGYRRRGVVLDAEAHPLLASRAPRAIRGPESELDAGLRLLARYPQARAVTVGPAGYTLDFEKRRLWLARPEVPAPSPPRGHVYAWGVSVGP